MNIVPGIYRKGERGFIAPGSAAHNAVISPSKVAAILGLSRWDSAYQLWHRMKGIVPPEPPKDTFDAGHAFEATMAYLWKLENEGWRLSPAEVQIVGDPTRFGFPFVATLDRVGSRGAWRRVVEFKIANDADDAEWGDAGTDEVPPGYACQVNAQQGLTGITDFDGHLMLLPPRYKPRTYTMPWDPEFFFDVAIPKCKQFWDSLGADEPPPLDDSTATWDCVRKLHPEIDDTATADVDRQLAADLFEANTAHKEAEGRLRGLKTRLLDQMGDAKYARVDDTVIAERRPHARGGTALVLSRKSIPDYVLQGEQQ